MTTAPVMSRPSQIGDLLRRAGVVKALPGHRAAPGEMSLRALEERSGVSRHAIGRWMRALDDDERRRVDWHTLYRVTDSLGIPRAAAERARAADAGYHAVVDPALIADARAIAAELRAWAGHLTPRPQAAIRHLADRVDDLAHRLDLATTP